MEVRSPHLKISWYSPLIKDGVGGGCGLALNLKQFAAQLSSSELFLAFVAPLLAWLLQALVNSWVCLLGVLNEEMRARRYVLDNGWLRAFSVHRQSFLCSLLALRGWQRIITVCPELIFCYCEVAEQDSEDEGKNCQFCQLQQEQMMLYVLV